MMRFQNERIFVALTCLELDRVEENFLRKLKSSFFLNISPLSYVPRGGILLVNVRSVEKLNGIKCLG